MARVLMRAGKTPFEVFDANAIVQRNILSNNSGNILFLSSMFKALSTPGTEIVVNRNRIPKPQEADRINAEFDMLVIPLANAMKRGGESILHQWTELVKKLKIPCVVTGVGAQARLSDDDLADETLRTAVKGFVSAILDKSSTIGVRGEYTAEFLNRLGFSAVEVIGCPSMFTYGEQINVTKKVPRLSKESSIAFNFTRKMPPHVCEFLERSFQDHPSMTYVPQDIDDMRLMMWGRQFRHSGPHDVIPNNIEHPVFKESRALYFTDTPSWFSFMRNMDFSFGTRIHGNIAALLSGTPGFVIAHDSRTLELAEYFEIPHVRGNNVNGGTSIGELYEAADYSRLNDGHKARFAKFSDFLDKNGIDHIYKHTGAAEAYEKRLAEVQFASPLRPYTSDSQEILLGRMQAMLSYYDKELNKTANTAKIKDLEKRLAKLERKMDRPLVARWRRVQSSIRKRVPTFR